MASLTASRLKAIARLADDVQKALDGGVSHERGAIPDSFSLFAEAVAEVNASLADIQQLLLDGLRDEAVTIHDPALAKVAQRLAIQDRSEWVRVHAWLLEHGIRMPARVDLQVALDFEAALEEGDKLIHDLDDLRRLVLQRSSLVDRIAVLRRLRASDPSSPVWPTMLDEHESAIVRQCQLELREALAAADFEKLAEIESIVNDDEMTQVSPTLLAATRGAGDATALREHVARAEFAACQLTQAAEEGSSDDQAETLIELKDQFLSLLGVAETHAMSVQRSGNAPLQAQVRSAGLDAAPARIRSTVSGLLDKIEVLRHARDTRRAFGEGCQRLEYLCDHPPDRSTASQWLADVYRTDTDVRRCCQEFPDLAVPPLLMERVVRAVGAVESRDALRKRFLFVIVAAITTVLLGATAVTGVFLWRWGERGDRIQSLEREVAAAKQGYFTERTELVEQSAASQSHDSRIAGLVAEFDAALAVEQARYSRFDDLLLDYGTALDGVAAAVADRVSNENEHLEAWPVAVGRAATILAEARRLGGLPERRGVESLDAPMPASTRRRFQQEEDALADAERALAAHDAELERLACGAFGARLERLQAVLKGSPSRDDAQRISREVAELRRQATAARLESAGVPALAVQRVPPDVAAELEIVEKRVRTLLREPAVR